MMKKIRTALCLSSVLLMAPAAQAQWETNWLLGASIGYGQINGDSDLVHQHDLFGASTGFDHRNHSWLWGVLGGYQARCNEWLFGIELAADWLRRHNGDNVTFVDNGGFTWQASGDHHHDPLIGLTARFGYAVSCYFLPYIRLGVETHRHKHDVVAVREARTVGEVTFPELDYSLGGSRRSYNFIGGIGAEMPIPMCNGLSFRLEYDYHSRGRSNNANTVIADNGTVINLSGRSHANTGKASVVYNFF